MIVIKIVDRRKTIHKRSVYIIPILIMFFVGVGMDISVELFHNYRVSVSEDYAETVYSAICTVAALSYSVIALITDSLNTKYYGYNLKEILARGYINLKLYTVISMLIIGISTVVLFLRNMCNIVNTITMLMMGTVFLESYVGTEICKIILDETVCYKEIKNFLKGERNKSDNRILVEHDIKSLFNGIRDTINNDEKDNIVKIINLLKIVVERINSDDEMNRVYTSVIEIAPKLSLYWGYDFYITSILSVFSTEDENINEYLAEPLRKIEFMDKEQFIRNNFMVSLFEINTMDLYKQKKIQDITVINLMLIYFEKTISNELVSDKTKYKCLKNFWNKVCSFNWKDDGTKSLNVEHMVVLNLFKKYIFSNSKDISRQEFMDGFLLAMRKHQSWKMDNKCSYFLSQLCEAFYFYTFKENELIKEEARLDFKNLFQYRTQTIENEHISLSVFIEKNISDVIQELGKHIATLGSEYRVFEYFSEYPIMKKIVWTEEENIKFILILYNIYWDYFCTDSFWDLCFSKTIMMPETKKTTILSVLELFDKDLELYSVQFKEELEGAKEFFGRKFLAPEETQKLIFCQFNEMLKTINENDVDNEEVKPEVKKLQVDLNQYLIKNPIYGVNQNGVIEPYIKYQTNPYIHKKSDKNIIVYILYSASVQAIQDCIKKIATNICVEFNLEGIESMNKYLEKFQFDSTNFSYIDDWALSNYRNEKQYHELKKKYEDIEVIKTPNISSYLLFEKSKFMFKIKLTKIKMKDISEDECDEYLNNYQTQSGKYNIRGVLYTRDGAVSFLKRYYIKESVEFKLYYSFSKHDVTHIKCNPK